MNMCIYGDSVKKKEGGELQEGQKAGGRGKHARGRGEGEKRKKERVMRIEEEEQVRQDIEVGGERQVEKWVKSGKREGERQAVGNGKGQSRVRVK